MRPSSLAPEQLHVQPPVLSDPFPVSLECTTEHAALRQVQSLTAHVYPGWEPLPPGRYEQWLLINPDIFVCLFDASRSVLAYFDIFPLRPAFLRMFLDGHVAEHDIRNEDILSPAEAAHARDLYLGGMAVTSQHRHEGRKCAAILIWGLLEYLDHYYQSSPVRRLYAHAATSAGEHLLRRFQFQKVAEADGRKEPFPLYAAELSDEWRECVRCNVPDFTNVVRLGWAR